MQHSVLLVLPIVLPMAMGAVSLLVWRNRLLQRWLGIVGIGLLLVIAVKLLWVVDGQGIQSVQVGNWPAPFGITLVADLFSAIMVVMAGLIGFCVVLYSLFHMEADRESFGYYALLQFLLMGVCGAFLTGDIFNLYVWFEVLLLASFVLMALGGERPQMEGAIKYVMLNLVSSACFLAAVGILYGVMGTLNMADLAVQLPQLGSPGLTLAIAMLFLVAFGIKAAVFPMFFWLPASYHTPPVAVSALFAGLLTKVGVYALIRVFTLLFVQEVGFTHTLLLWVAAFTMVTGVLGAVAQYEFRRLLSFHIISQIGYMVLGLGLYTPLALGGAIFFMVHNILAKTNLFLVSGVAHRLKGTFDLKKLGGLYHAHPWLAVWFLLSALSLAGVPPLSGFFGKLMLIQAGLATGHYGLVAVALFVSLLTLFSMTKIWGEAFWKPDPQPSAPCVSAGWQGMFYPVACLALGTLLMGLLAGPCFELTYRAGEQLIHPTAYIAAVLGDKP